MDTKGYSGKTMNKSITVHTSDPHKKKVVLSVKGAVETVVNVSPRVARLKGKAGEKIETVVRITPESKYPLTPLALTLKEGKNITAEMVPSRVSKGGWDIIIRNTKGKPGRYFDMITISTDSKIQPEIRINVFGNIIK